jgi:hypothetical protein
VYYASSIVAETPKNDYCWKCTDFYSDMSQGLFSRPGANQLSTLTALGSDASIGTPGVYSSQFIVKANGNLIQTYYGNTKWQSNSGQSPASSSYRLVMQQDGNLVLYDASNSVKFTSNTNQPAGKTDYRASLRGNALLKVYASGPQCKVLWSNGGTSSTSWTLLSPTLRQVSRTKTLLCGTNSNNQLYCSSTFNQATPSFYQLTGNFKWISLDGKRACAINTVNQVVCTDDVTVASPSWTLISGQALVQIDVEGLNMCGVDASNKVYCATFKQNNWRQLVGASNTQVALYGKRICGVNSLNEAYCSHDLTASTVRWFKLGKSFRYVDTFYANVCGVGTDNILYCSFFGQEAWVNKGSNMAQIAMIDYEAAAVSTTSNVYYTTLLSEDDSTY